MAAPSSYRLTVIFGLYSLKQVWYWLPGYKADCFPTVPSNFF